MLRDARERDGAYYTVGKYPLVKTFSNEVFPHAPSPLRMLSAPAPYMYPLHARDAYPVHIIQQHQLPLHRFRPSAQRHLSNPPAWSLSLDLGR